VADLDARRRKPKEDDVFHERRTSRRLRLALGLVAALFAAACQTGGGIGMDLNSPGPGWGPFTGGVMYGAPAWN
jgi:hypothetical protein